MKIAKYRLVETRVWTRVLPSSTRDSPSLPKLASNRLESRLAEYYSRILFEISRAVMFYIYKPNHEGFDQYNTISYSLPYYPIYFHYHNHQNKWFTLSLPPISEPREQIVQAAFIALSFRLAKNRFIVENRNNFTRINFYRDYSIYKTKRYCPESRVAIATTTRSSLLGIASFDSN
jgi:hypothetical protein